jgi:hypothetical protein
MPGGDQARPENRVRNSLTGASGLRRHIVQERRPRDVHAGEAAVMDNVPPLLGKLVRRSDREDVGVIVGLLFCPPERAIVRWVGETTFEAMEDLADVQAARRMRSWTAPAFGT